MDSFCFWRSREQSCSTVSAQGAISPERPRRSMAIRSGSLAKSCAWRASTRRNTGRPAAIVPVARSPAAGRPGVPWPRCWRSATSTARSPGPIAMAADWRAAGRATPRSTRLWCARATRSPMAPTRPRRPRRRRPAAASGRRASNGRRTGAAAIRAEPGQSHANSSILLAAQVFSSPARAT
ncbi:hypothetical protein BOS5A_231292 [Bosea sp. EC-HK365B]|nr:hypothetical protein BOS5A_231292 [Bosea sp. EC-HK365B]